MESGVEAKSGGTADPRAEAGFEGSSARPVERSAPFLNSRAFAGASGIDLLDIVNFNACALGR
ncbi:hypothetical protein [Methylocella tundrae]|uniref:hypothetical protein n=1 Tax=Methylocella tundrae TaxID=227605 RepID=UPI00106A06F4|nr:hypothetical protein [Methylocella tundrae]